MPSCSCGLTSSGFMCFGPAFFASAAFILSIIANTFCNLVSIDENSSLRDIRGLPEPNAFGLWCYEATNGVNYDLRDKDFGSKIEAARALGTTTNVLGLCVWLFYLIAGCNPMGPGAFKIVGCFCFLCTLFQGLVFLVYRSDQICYGDDLGCGLDTAGKCAIAAIVCWYVAGGMSCASGKTAEPEEESPSTEDAKKEEEDAAKVEETENKDEEAGGDDQ